MPGPLAPLLLAADLAVLDSAAPPATGVTLPLDSDEQADDVRKVEALVRLLDAHRPCLFRAVRLWAGPLPDAAS